MNRDFNLFPLWVLLILAVSIKAIAITIIYFTFHNLPLAILDSGLFLIFLVPLLYALVFRPMVKHLKYRNESERKLMENEFRFNAFYQSGLMGVYYWDLNGTIADANDKFLELTGYSKEDLKQGQIQWQNLSPEEYHEKDVQYLQQMMQYGSNKQPFERELLTKKGDRIWVETAIALFDSENINGVSFILDINERKNLEQLRINYAKELEQTVKIRTQELEIAKEKAESADRLKSTFISNISHEFRTPLNSILGFSGILLMGKPGALNEEQKKQIEMIKISGNQLLSLVNGLLNFSKIEAGEFSITRESFCIQELIKEVIQRELPYAKAKNLEIKFEKVNQTNQIYSDKDKVAQILLALINNAIKFTASGYIKVGCHQSENQIKVEVTDTGMGIKKEDLHKIFQPFSKLENNLVRQSSGAGLGLSIYRKFAEKLNGSLSIISEYGKGSTFTLSLPVTT